MINKISKTRFLVNQIIKKAVSKAIYICSRTVFSKSVEKLMRIICNRLSPDNITPKEPLIAINGNIAFGIINPMKTILVNGTSLLLGKIFDENENWDAPLNDFPDGSYALFRNGEDYCEIVSDPVASRTIWYYFDDDMFIASTSQRAIVMYLGNLEFDDRVFPWMLSTGSLGPIFSWDKRIRRVPADSSVILDKEKWTLSGKLNPIEFNTAKMPGKKHEEVLLETLKTTFKTLNIDYSSWALPLSGGYDSRMILCLLLNLHSGANRLRTITWGLKSSQGIKGNDAYVAKELANKLNVDHKYYDNDLTEKSIESIINRFIILGEGRIDHLSDYMDGFRTWKALFEDGIEGTIRGDEAFGCPKILIAKKNNLENSLCSDFSNLNNYKKFGLPTQEKPQYFTRRKGETLCKWQDRLYQEYRLSTIQSALADLKLPYGEQISPFLSKRILMQVRMLPDRLRANKVLFKKIVRSLSPEVEYATSASSATPAEILKQKPIVDLLKMELSSDTAKKLLNAEFLELILVEMKSKDQIETYKDNPYSVKFLIKKLIPRILIEVIRGNIILPKIDNNILAFRIFLIIRMNKILNEDCRIKAFL